MRNWADFFTFIKSQGFDPATVVDVGVATDTYELYQHFPNARYLFVEPLIEFEPNLQQLCKQFRGDYVLAAAGPTTGEITFNVSTDLGGSTRFEITDIDSGIMKSRTVPQITLDSQWDKFNLAGPALLKVDVQGGELEVIKGMQTCLTNFEVIVLEVNLIQSNNGQPILHEYLSYMAGRGYVTYDIIHLNYAQTNLLAQMDIVFVKKDSVYRKNQSWFASPADARNFGETVKHYKGVTRNETI